MSLTAPLLPAAHALGTGTSEIIVAYASGPADIPKAWDGLQLPHLQALLATLKPTTVVQGDEMDFSPPHERVLARAMQLPDTNGLIPWAALAAKDTTAACRRLVQIITTAQACSPCQNMPASHARQ